MRCLRPAVLAAGQAAAPRLAGGCGEWAELPGAGRGPSNPAPLGVPERERRVSPRAPLPRPASSAAGHPWAPSRAGHQAPDPDHALSGTPRLSPSLSLPALPSVLPPEML